jgi:hypothetical protein
VNEDLTKLPGGWLLERIQCTGGKNGPVTIDMPTGGITIPVNQGDDIRCTFWNTLPRMTGGGSVFLTDTWQGPNPLSEPAGTRVTHGFELYCGASSKHNANNLEINWAGVGGKTSQYAFHLDKLDFGKVICDGPGTGQPQGPEMPNAPFNHYHGEGTGSINSGKPNSYAIVFDIYDHGEPGRVDTWSATIWQLDDQGKKISPAIISFGLLYLDQGNHQAH